MVMVNKHIKILNIISNQGGRRRRENQQNYSQNGHKRVKSGYHGIS
jgi:hypothetical protein